MSKTQGIYSPAHFDSLKEFTVGGNEDLSAAEVKDYYTLQYQNGDAKLKSVISIICDPATGTGDEKITMPGSIPSTTVLSASAPGSIIVATGATTVVAYMSPHACVFNGVCSVVVYQFNDAGGLVAIPKTLQWGPIFNDFNAVSIVSASLGVANASSFNTRSGTINAGIYVSREVGPGAMTMDELTTSRILESDVLSNIPSDKGAVICWRAEDLGKKLRLQYNNAATSSFRGSFLAEDSDRHTRVRLGNASVSPIGVTLSDSDTLAASGFAFSNSSSYIITPLTVGTVSNHSHNIFDSNTLTDKIMDPYNSKFVLNLLYPGSFGTFNDAIGTVPAVYAHVMAVWTVTAFGSPGRDGVYLPYTYSETFKQYQQVLFGQSANNATVDNIFLVPTLSIVDMPIQFAAGRCEPISRITIALSFVFSDGGTAGNSLGTATSMSFKYINGQGSLSLDVMGAGEYGDRKMFAVIDGINAGENIRLQMSANLSVIPKTSTASMLRKRDAFICSDHAVTSSLLNLSHNLQCVYTLDSYREMVDFCRTKAFVDSFSPESSSASSAAVNKGMIVASKVLGPMAEKAAGSLFGPMGTKVAHAGLGLIRKYASGQLKKDKKKEKKEKEKDEEAQPSSPSS